MSKVTLRLRVFDAATRRQAERQAEARRRPVTGGDRGWTREELYQRGGSRRLYGTVRIVDPFA